MRNNSKKFRVLLCLGILILLVLSMLVYRSGNQKMDYVFIEGLEDCSKGIQNNTIDELGTTMHSYVKSANNYNKVSTANTYNAMIRDKSCVVQKDETVSTETGKKQRVVSTKIIVDIPEAKQSWQVFYEWSPSKGNIDTVVNGARAECLAKNELIYGDFKCDNILSLQLYGTDKYDPIMQYMPYTGQIFNLRFDPNTKKVTAQILVKPKDINNTQLIENDKAAVLYWFNKRGLDPKNYIVEYSVATKED